MTTDNRTNDKPSISPNNVGETGSGLQFTDEQVEAAAKVMWKERALGTATPDYPWLGLAEEGRERLRVHAREVLVAAQCAAPQPIGRLDLARHYWRSQGYDYDLHGLDGNSDYEMGLAVADAALAALAAAQGAAPQAVKDVHEPSHDRVYCVRCGGNWPCQPAPAPPSSDVDEDALIREARAEALEDAARAFDGGTISLDVFSNEVEKSYWRVANEQRSILVDSLRARAAGYRKAAR